MLIIAIILIAMATGWIAQMILGRNTPGRNNWGEAIVAGFVGSLVGGLLISLLARDRLDLKPSGIIGSVVGAVIVLAVWGAIRGKRTA
ncbi:MAG TPA: GlsB/YeaQ/YmgE family stress response membrane protein [Actinomycetota bacterium]|nr:GlsB/YeaQ/YmgE family stress response membrane protein [Actinomycetota bacterium]